jgi:hypothetical protein
MRHHLKLGPRFSQQLRTVIKELFEFRSSAVHPSSQMLIRRAPSMLDSDSVKIGRVDGEVRRLCFKGVSLAGGVPGGLLHCAESEQPRSLIEVDQITRASSSKAARIRRFTVSSGPSS